MTKKICDNTCHYAHFWDLGLMYCQRCSGLITDKEKITKCFESWKKTDEIPGYMLRLERRIARINEVKTGEILWELKN